MSTLEETNPQPGDFIRLKYSPDEEGPAESATYRGKVVEYTPGNLLEISCDERSVAFDFATDKGEYEVINHVPASKGQWVEIVTGDCTVVRWRDSQGKYSLYPQSGVKGDEFEGALQITPLVAEDD